MDLIPNKLLFGSFLNQSAGVLEVGLHITRFRHDSDDNDVFLRLHLSVSGERL